MERKLVELNACGCGTLVEFNVRVEWFLKKGGKVHDVECECNHNNDDGACEHGGARVMLKGSSTFVSMYSQKGSKGVNQDALTVWQHEP
ncbi:hypothetical protein JHK86_001577 [Glycine max]|nr:hypothetical protein JHK86_001577 [Glycine max]